MTLYKVTIQLAPGVQVQFVEPSILQAAQRAEKYHGNMLWCEIQQIDGREDNGGGQVDQAGNGIAG